MQGIKKWLRLRFWRVKNEDDSPCVCIECGSRNFKQENKHYINSILMEADIVCQRCGSHEGFYTAGYYLHRNDERYSTCDT